MAETIEERLQTLEAFHTEYYDLGVKLGDIREVLQRVWAVLDDLIKDRDDADEYADDLERIETLSRLL